MRFKRSMAAYGRTPEPVTPYQKAGQIWDERIGSARQQAQSWRLMAFGCLALSVGLSGALVWRSLQSRVVPYVVEIDRLGAPRAIGEAQRAFQPTDPQIAWSLSHFIADIRGRSLDPVLMRKGWLEAYDFATRRGARFLNAYARTSGALTRIGERTVSVQVTSVVRASNASFQVEWIESEFERGSPAGSSRWTAILTIVERAPTDAATLRKNPLGIYVDAIDWSREFEPDSAARGTHPADPSAPHAFAPEETAP